MEAPDDPQPDSPGPDRGSTGPERGSAEFDRGSTGQEPDSTGFEVSRRTVLKSSASLGVASSIAGCGDSGSDTSTTEPPPVEPMSDLIADGLEIVGAHFVDNQGTWIDLGGSVPSDQATASVNDAVSKSALRVRVRNTTSKTITVVQLTLEVFDEDLNFLGTQSAMISSLLANEVFEGHIPYLYRDKGAAYVLRADRSYRPEGAAQINRVRLEYHCINNEQVEGTVRHTGGLAVDRCRVLVRFYDADGRVLGTGTDTITGLGGNERAEYEVDANTVLERKVTAIDDYTVSIGDYDGQSLAVR